MLITQSGETADTITPSGKPKLKGQNPSDLQRGRPMITREAAETIYTHAGPEIGVASTKAFTAQLTALYLFAPYLAPAAP
jgi:glucosamine--fructose-6-phosphate aminotransferase (isomerizing)